MLTMKQVVVAAALALTPLYGMDDSLESEGQTSSIEMGTKDSEIKVYFAQHIPITPNLPNKALTIKVWDDAFFAQLIPLAHTFSEMGFQKKIINLIFFPLFKAAMDFRIRFYQAYDSLYLSDLIEEFISSCSVDLIASQVLDAPDFILCNLRESAFKSHDTNTIIFTFKMSQLQTISSGATSNKFFRHYCKYLDYAFCNGNKEVLIAVIKFAGTDSYNLVLQWYSIFALSSFKPQEHNDIWKIMNFIQQSKDPSLLDSYPTSIPELKFPDQRKQDIPPSRHSKNIFTKSKRCVTQ